MVIAKKSLGQNFLTDQSAIDEIIEAAELKSSDTVLEIGPGKGAITSIMAEKVGKLICVELDQRLIPWLKVDYEKYKNVEIVHADALKYTPPSTPYKIVANIPYYITSPLLNHYLMDQFIDGNPPELIVFTIQNEVADKIVAKDGNESVLSLQVKLFGEVEKVRVIKAASFNPAPKVDSAVIKIRTFKEPKVKGDLKKFFWLLHASFAQKRKKLSNNLSAALRRPPAEIRALLNHLGIDEDARAEVLTFEEWTKLFNELDLNPRSSK